MTKKALTGRKVFFVFASAFGVIIGVNILMAYMAVSTFPGLETKNSYVASQSFDADRAAQLSLGWKVESDVTDGNLRLAISDQQGQPVKVDRLESTLGRATHVGEDRNPEFTFDGSGYNAPVELASGNWNLRIIAHSADGIVFRQRIVLNVRNSN